MKTLSAFRKLLLFFVPLLCGAARAGTVTGTISLPSSGQGVANGTLTFSLTQAAVLSGTATLVTTPASCYTDAGGNVVGVPNPLVAPAPSQNLGSGTLPAGTYFYRVTYFNASGESAPSPENSFTTTGTDTLIIAALPAKSGATGYNVYISTTSGAETRQGSVTGFASNYSQATGLAAGAALPVSNSSVCSIFFNDQLTPSYTGYNVNLVNSAGAQVGGFPQKWYLSGGASGTVNVSQGAPLYSGIVVYPQPIVTTPVNNAQQSINGPLNLNGFSLTGVGAIQGPGYQRQIFTSSGTFIIPPGVTQVKVTVVGGGGAGGGSDATHVGSGGGSGGVAIKWLTGLTPGNTLTVTVGAGGAAVSAGAGNNGGSSSISSGTQAIGTITAGGGLGGNTGTTYAFGGFPSGVPTGGDVNSSGNAGNHSAGTTWSGSGAAGPFGGGGAGGGNNPGNSAAGPGAGGGGSSMGSNGPGGNGGSGIVIFEWIT